MILSKQSIIDAVQKGEIGISPFDETNLKDASYTFTLAPKLLIHGIEQVMGEDGYALQPGEFVLGYTAEKLTLHGKYGCIMSTRGSVAQKGLSVLLGSAFAEPDTDNVIILEIHNASAVPILLTPDLKIVKGVFAPVG